MPNRSAAVAFATLAACLACAGAPVSPARQDAAAALIAADTAFSEACARHDREATVELVAGDALFLARRGVLRGRAEFLEGWKELLSDGGPVLRWAPRRADASDSGDLGFTVGTWRLESTDGHVSRGEYVTVWRRDDDGQFRALFDGPLQEPAPAANAARTSMRSVRSDAGDLLAEVGTIGARGGETALYLTVSRATGGVWSRVLETTVAVSASRP